MSSPRGVRECQAVLHCPADGGIKRTVPSPIALPEVDRDAFVDEFHRVYASLGWTIEMIKTIAPKSEQAKKDPR